MQRYTITTYTKKSGNIYCVIDRKAPNNKQPAIVKAYDSLDYGKEALNLASKYANILNMETNNAKKQ